MVRTKMMGRVRAQENSFAEERAFRQIRVNMGSVQTMFSKQVEDCKVELHPKIESIVFEKFEPPSNGREVQSMDATKRGERHFGSSKTE